MIAAIAANSDQGIKTDVSHIMCIRSHSFMCVLHRSVASCSGYLKFGSDLSNRVTHILGFVNKCHYG